MAKKNKAAKSASPVTDPDKAAKKESKAAKKAAKGDKKVKKQSKKLAPKEVKTGKGATPMEIGQAVVASINAGKPDKELWDAYWSKKVESIEGVGVNMKWTGRKAMEAKGEAWMATHKIYSASAEGPYVGATGFTVRFTMDVEDTTTGKRQTMNEVGVYTVKGGKVVCEEFMYKV
jgi:hypothetical protein